MDRHSPGRPQPADRATQPVAARAVGVDIGGSGIKGAPVAADRGELAGDRVRVPTPQPSTPTAVAAVVADIVARCGAGPVGVTFPAVVQQGVARTAANVDPSWVGTDVSAVLAEATGRQVVVVNDADAAGVAEARWGAARDVSGVVLVTTLGTGIGSALLVGGRLVPNTELGHLQVDGVDAETRASEAARTREGLDWRQWAERLQRYYRTVEDLLWPDLIVVGGGVSKEHEQFLPLLDLRTPVVPAVLRNRAGIIGAATLAVEAC